MEHCLGFVNCSYCGEQYHSDIGINQGYDIASDLFADGVICGYGSRFDGMVFIFDEPVERENLFTGRPVQICDACICSLLEEELISLVDDYMYPFTGRDGIILELLEEGELAVREIMKDIKREAEDE